MQCIDALGKLPLEERDRAIRALAAFYDVHLSPQQGKSR